MGVKLVKSLLSPTVEQWGFNVNLHCYMKIWDPAFQMLHYIYLLPDVENGMCLGWLYDPLTVLAAEMPKWAINICNYYNFKAFIGVFVENIQFLNFPLPSLPSSVFTFIMFQLFALQIEKLLILFDRNLYGGGAVGSTAALQWEYLPAWSDCTCACEGFLQVLDFLS